MIHSQGEAGTGGSSGIPGQFGPGGKTGEAGAKGQKGTQGQAVSVMIYVVGNTKRDSIANPTVTLSMICHNVKHKCMLSCDTAENNHSLFLF